jgi:hypothetical protein
MEPIAYLRGGAAHEGPLEAKAHDYVRTTSPSYLSLTALTLGSAGSGMAGQHRHLL